MWNGWEETGTIRLQSMNDASLSELLMRMSTEKWQELRLYFHMLPDTLHLDGLLKWIQTCPSLQVVELNHMNYWQIGSLQGRFLRATLSNQNVRRLELHDTRVSFATMCNLLEHAQHLDHLVLSQVAWGTSAHPHRDGMGDLQRAARQCRIPGFTFSLAWPSTVQTAAILCGLKDNPWVQELEVGDHVRSFRDSPVPEGSLEVLSPILEFGSILTLIVSTNFPNKETIQTLTNQHQRSSLYHFMVHVFQVTETKTRAYEETLSCFESPRWSSSWRRFLFVSDKTAEPVLLQLRCVQYLVAEYVTGCTLSHYESLKAARERYRAANERDRSPRRIFAPWSSAFRRWRQPKSKYPTYHV